MGKQLGAKRAPEPDPDPRPGPIRILVHRQTAPPLGANEVGGYHNAMLGSAAAEELPRNVILRLARCNAGGRDTEVPRPRDWKPKWLFGPDGYLRATPESDVRLLVDTCIAVWCDRPDADALVEALLRSLTAPPVEPFALRGSEPSVAATDLAKVIARCCWQAAELVGVTAQLEVTRGRLDRAGKLLTAGDRILSAPMLTRHSTGNTATRVDTGAIPCSMVDDVGHRIGWSMSGVDGMGEPRPVNSPEKADVVRLLAAERLAGLAAGLSGHMTEVPGANGGLARDAVAFGAALRHLRDPGREQDDRDALAELARASERTSGVSEVITMLLRHGPAETRHLEHQVLRGFSRYTDPTTHRRFPDQGRGAA